MIMLQIKVTFPFFKLTSVTETFGMLFRDWDKLLLVIIFRGIVGLHRFYFVIVGLYVIVVRQLLSVQEWVVVIGILVVLGIFNISQQIFQLIIRQVLRNCKIDIFNYVLFCFISLVEFGCPRAMSSLWQLNFRKANKQEKNIEKWLPEGVCGFPKGGQIQQVK